MDIQFSLTILLEEFDRLLLTPKVNFPLLLLSTVNIVGLGAYFDPIPGGYGGFFVFYNDDLFVNIFRELSLRLFEINPAPIFGTELELIMV